MATGGRVAEQSFHAVSTVERSRGGRISRLEILPPAFAAMLDRSLT